MEQYQICKLTGSTVTFIASNTHMTTNGLSSQIIVNFMLTSLTVCSKMINPVTVH